MMEASTFPCTPADKKYAGVTIADNGCGMTEDTMKMIFDPFFTRKPKGTGLGLSIVQRLISSWNGFIDVKERSRQGKFFYRQVSAHSSSPLIIVLTVHSKWDSKPD